MTPIEELCTDSINVIKERLGSVINLRDRSGGKVLGPTTEASDPICLQGVINFEALDNSRGEGCRSKRKVKSKGGVVRSDGIRKGNGNWGNHIMEKRSVIQKDKIKD